MQREPPPFVWAAPEEKDILTCAPILSPSVYSLLTHFSYREFYHRTRRSPGALREWLTLDLLSQHGPPDSSYVGGEYHGVLMFPSEYPFKPPGIKVRRVASALAIHVPNMRS